MTTRAKSFLLVDRKVNKALFLLEKLEGPLFWGVGVEDLPGDLFFHKEVKEVKLEGAFFLFSMIR